MFFHKHPYQPFIHQDTIKLIVGTLPPPRFSTGDLLEKDVDFCYGSYYNSLWLFIDEIHQLGLRYDNSQAAINERKQFLMKHKIGVCDIVESAERQKIDASDLGMINIKLRNVVGYLKQFPTIETILFTGGNSKNGPEYFFRRHLRDYNKTLELLSNEVPRVHQFELEGRLIKTVSLTSGSGAANISISRLPLYKQLKAQHPEFNTFDFRVLQYREFL
ncbi:uracil-DNA glycosylase family protein [uncultured Psychroserpens sp.]|uniref:uracil-DNA glycosylase family protein n=1 Tax=uncultured Psychroserpens sp. TaxID=255436 RepID=UPI0026094558|nr:uracil-DNA glycosylase family protein [uncultured Psychroserpens sp.]